VRSSQEEGGIRDMVQLKRLIPRYLRQLDQGSRKSSRSNMEIRINIVLDLEE